MHAYRTFPEPQNQNAGSTLGLCVLENLPRVEPLHYSLTSSVPTTFEIKGKHTSIDYVPLSAVRLLNGLPFDQCLVCFKILQQ